MSTECIAIIGVTATVLAGFGGAALCAFKAYLSSKERNRIDEAWNKYRTQSDSYDSKPMPDEEKKAALQEIHNVLNKFASFR